MYVDYNPVLFDGDTPRLADNGVHKDGLRIVEASLPGDTALNLPQDKMREGRGFGFQIFPSKFECHLYGVER